jgi:hypothetical protein
LIVKIRYQETLRKKQCTGTAIVESGNQGTNSESRMRRQRGARIFYFHNLLYIISRICNKCVKVLTRERVIAQ